MPPLLTEVVRATAGAADSGVLLDRVARVLAAQFSWVVADRLDEPDLVTRIAAYDADGPLPMPTGTGAPTSRRSTAGGIGVLPALLGTPQRMLLLGRDTLAEMEVSAEPHLAGQARSALALGAHELLLVALVSRDLPLGVLAVGSSTGFREGEVAGLLDVGLHVGLALDAARLVAVQTEIATAMQTSLLPPLPVVAGLALAARYCPAARGLEVGGDWYDAFPTSAGLMVAVGDVRGHDLPAAARMADLRNLFRAHAVDRDEPPSALVSRLERTAGALGLETGATLVAGRLRRAATGFDLQWTSAGHLPPVHLHDGRARLVETEADLMLGVDADTVRSDHRLHLAPGDVLLLCTDGLVEQRETSLDSRLELLRSLVQQHADVSPDHLVETLLTELGAGSTDDVALLALRVTG